MPKRDQADTFCDPPPALECGRCRGTGYVHRIRPGAQHAMLCPECGGSGKHTPEIKPKLTYTKLDCCGTEGCKVSHETIHEV